MARTDPKAQKATKEPGRIRQMFQVFQMTRKYDPTAQWIMLAAFVLPVLAGVLVAVLFARQNVVGLVLYILIGVLVGVLLTLIVLGRRAERAAYSQIEGQPGAVGAVLKNGLRRSWTGSEMPVNVSPRTQDAVYRAVGRGGVVLIGEGPKSRTRRMLDDERRNVLRIVPNVPVNTLFVGPDPDSVPLHRIPKALNGFKNTLTRQEVSAISNRLSSLSRGPKLPIPKGVDPTKVRAPRPR